MSKPMLVFVIMYWVGSNTAQAVCLLGTFKNVMYSFSSERYIGDRGPLTKCPLYRGESGFGPAAEQGDILSILNSMALLEARVLFE